MRNADLARHKEAAGRVVRFDGSAMFRERRDDREVVAAPFLSDLGVLEVEALRLGREVVELDLERWIARAAP